MNSIYFFIKKKIVNIDKISILYLIFPYIAFNLDNILNARDSNFYELIVTFAFVISIDLIIKNISCIKNKFILTKVILFFCITFFYGFYITNFIQNIILKYTGAIIRGRNLLFYFSILIILFLYFKKSKSYRVLNIYLLIYTCIILILNRNKEFKKNNLDFIKSKYYTQTSENKKNKPVILIILDEYQSPKELYKVYKDSNIFNFSRKLKIKGWIIRDSSFTYETSTIHSLSSLFNYNLSAENKYSNFDVAQIGVKKLLNAKMAVDLCNKQIRIINFGILNIGSANPLTELYFYPKNFIETLLNNTIYYHFINNTNHLSFKGLNNNFYPSESHNKIIFENLSDSLEKFKNKNIFVYTHLFMPHAPLTFYSEFKKINKQDLDSYFKFWNFTNYKITELINKLVKENKYKIILTGDHGYRRDKRVNPNSTFSAFYGFDQNSLSDINSVQDFGILINRCY